MLLGARAAELMRSADAGLFSARRKRRGGSPGPRGLSPGRRRLGPAETAWASHPPIEVAASGYRSLSGAPRFGLSGGVGRTTSSAAGRRREASAEQSLQRRARPSSARQGACGDRPPLSSVVRRLSAQPMADWAEVYRGLRMPIRRRPASNHPRTRSRIGSSTRFGFYQSPLALWAWIHCSDRNSYRRLPRFALPVCRVHDRLVPRRRVQPQRIAQLLYRQ